MGRRHNEAEGTWGPCLTLLLITFISCVSIYFILSPLFHPSSPHVISSLNSTFGKTEFIAKGDGLKPLSCCRGLANTELWGSAVKWGSGFKVKTAQECCQACKSMCSNDGSCRCNSWVFCSDQKRCGTRFGECWLKRQKDLLAPEVANSPGSNLWTSGLVFGKGEGIVSLETQYGAIRIKLFPDCAPHSVAYVLQLLGARLCAGCQFYRAEKRGNFWDKNGNPISQSSHGPPYALLQGTLEAIGVDFTAIPKEISSKVDRGSVAWVNGGSDFFISLANHYEWGNTYTVFAKVLQEDMPVVEKIVELPTRSEIWSGIKVAALEKHINFKVKRPVIIGN